MTLAIRERPPLRHSIQVQTLSGRRYRWATDEPTAKNVPSGLRWSSQMPGGYERMDCVLPRKPGADYADLGEFNTLTICDAAGSNVGEYRVERAPSSSGERLATSPSAVGWQAALDDDKSVGGIYVDRDNSRWRGYSDPAKAAQIAAGYIETPGSVLQGGSSPALELGWTGAWNHKQDSTLVYESGPSLKVQVIWVAHSGGSGVTAVSPWEHRVYCDDTDAFTGGNVPFVNADFAGASTYLTFGSPRRMMGINLHHDAPTPPYGDDGAERRSWFRNVTVYGDHGLPVQRDAGDPGGLLASDIITHALRRAPLLNWTTGFEGTVRPSSYIIVHLAFYDPTTVAEIIRQATRFELLDWAVWDDRTFHLTERGGQARHWRARVGPAQLEETGKDASRVWESVLVSYRDVDGTTKTAGPPGSGADGESAYLKDADPENPANLLGAPRRDLLQMGTATQASATDVGRRFLEQAKLLDRSGRARLHGHVEDQHGVLHPYSHVRGGDTIIFTDAHDTSPRRIVRAEHSESDKACSVDLDAPPEGLQALLERLSVTLVPLGA